MPAPLAEHLRLLSEAPKEPAERDAWLRLEDAVDFLEQDAVRAWFTVYVSSDHVFINTIFVPTARLTPPNVDDLMKWNFNAHQSWSFSYRPSDPSIVTLRHPLQDADSEAMTHGEQIVFARRFDGLIQSDKGYLELLQKFIHLSGLHFLSERNAFSTINDNGDIDDCVRIIKLDEDRDGLDGSAVEIRRDILDRYMALTGHSLVRMFDFTRVDHETFSGWHGEQSASVTSRGSVHYRVHIQQPVASYARGVQIVHSRTPSEAIMRGLTSLGDEDREYASFIAHDWKNNATIEISTAPGATANYFTKSPLPYETSPAFFRPEVLTKYKADKAKYRLGDRTISCRDAWSLQTYDINEAGQVHTYIVYLRHLPYSEQLYWKAYNEPPKAGLSKRALMSDFQGAWDTEPDPLQALKGHLADLQSRRVSWWRLRSSDLPGNVHYPVTASPDEWLDELLKLDQLVVEGLVDRWWKERSEILGYEPRPQDRSLNLIQAVLIKSGFEDAHARGLLSPFRELHGLRQLKGHAAGDGLRAAQKDVLQQFGSFREYFGNLCRRCDESLASLTRVADELQEARQPARQES